MKLPKKLMIGATVCIIAPALLFAAYGLLKRSQVAETRQQLKTQGFKTELSEFPSKFTSEATARGEIVLNADIGLEGTLATSIRAPVELAAAAFSKHTSNSVVVPWREEFYAGARKRSPWPAVRQNLEKHRGKLDAAILALIDGPIAIVTKPADPDDHHVNEDQRTIRDAAKALSCDLLSKLYYGERSDAWTNLLALTRLVTRLEPEPIDFRQRQHLQLMPIVHVATWNALQDHTWSDQQLAALQDEWSEINFFEKLPESVAYERATVRGKFETIRRPRNETSGIELRDLVKEPKWIPRIMKWTVQMAVYRWAGSYNDERNALLFLRDREVDLRRAIEASTLVAMRGLPSVTNAPVFQSRYGPGVSANFTSEYFFFASRNERTFGSLAYAADAEIRRRIILTAIALERFKLRNGAYPEKLDELTGVDSKRLIDFADGQSLRYKRTDDHFILYSIGLDCLDNQGDPFGSKSPQTRSGPLNRIQGIDIVWPAPATLPKREIQEPQE